MIPFFLMPDWYQKRLREQEKADLERRLTECVNWHSKMPWKKEMNLKASSYTCLNLFPDVIPKNRHPNPNNCKEGEYVDSPSGDWRYVVNVVPRGTKLSTWSGNRIGSVIFDGPVNVPAIYSREKWRKDIGYKEEPWMSLTPAELMSMRTGLRFASGHTIVAGLGLGHLLIEVTKKRSVKRVTLVEINQELIDWLYPKIKEHLAQDVKVIVGDANHIIPGLEADAALIDIDSSYGSNEFHAPKEHIRKVWVWGTAAIGEGSAYC